jgi:hypothetical protein
MPFFSMGSRTPSRSTTPNRSRTPSPSALAVKHLRLRVRIGSSYDRSTHTEANVNDPDHPTLIQSENFSGHVVVRVRDYTGRPGDEGIAEDEEYFKGTRDTCSIMFGGWFHHKGKQWSVDDIVFGVPPLFLRLMRMTLTSRLQINYQPELPWD